MKHMFYRFWSSVHYSAEPVNIQVLYSVGLRLCRLCLNALRSLASMLMDALKRLKIADDDSNLFAEATMV